MDYSKNSKTRKRKRSFILDLFKDFNANSTLHGLKYFTESDISFIERLFWIVTFILSLSLCCMLIYSVWNKWQDSPVIVSFSEKMIPVWKVPFPSLTICPRTNTQIFVYNFTENVQKFQNGSFEKGNGTSRFLEKMDNVALVCGKNVHVRFTDRDICDQTSVDDLIEVAPRIDNIFKKCLWRGKKENCSDLFKKVVTFHGICYNFNGLPASDIFDYNRLKASTVNNLTTGNIQRGYTYMYTTKPVSGWSSETGYELTIDNNMYPRRGHQNSALPDLEIELLENVEKQDQLCIGNKRGFKIILHHPGDSPRAKPFYHIQGGQEAALSISFHMMTTSEKLRNYSPRVRQCYFPSERKLRYFKEYTQKNCERECRANYTFSKCGCVWFNMPHNDSKQICCQNKRKCISESDEELTTQEMKFAQEVAAGKVAEGGCRCLPACNSIKYEAGLLKSPHTKTAIVRFDRNTSNFAENITETQLEYEIAKLEVNYKDSQFASLSRSELFGLTDFMANCGGLLGLFLGFSFLSIVEILYYSTLRLCCIIRRESNNYNVTNINGNVKSVIPNDK